MLGKVTYHLFRWNYQLHPSIKKEEWSGEEVNILIQLHDDLGNKWKTISQQLPGRTNNGTKIFFNSGLKKGIQVLYPFISK